MREKVIDNLSAITIKGRFKQKATKLVDIALTPIKTLREKIINNVIISAMEKGTSSVLNSVIEENKMLKELAMKDTLTGLYNRRFFNEEMQSLASYASRHNEALSCIMMDIDHFKKINDTYGHDIGDKTLKHIGKILGNSVRNEDIAARYGGEEFVILCRNTDLKGVTELAKRIKHTIDLEVQKDFDSKELNTKYTVSIGINSVSSIDPSITSKELSSQDRLDKISHFLIKPADNSLYYIKNNGRNGIALGNNTIVQGNIA